jgi:hypothetical protein
MWKQGSVNKIWRKRYFILTQGCLAYWGSVPPRNTPSGTSSSSAPSLALSSLSSAGSSSRNRGNSSSSGSSSNADKNLTASTPPNGLIPLENCEVEEEADKTTGYRFSFIIFTALDRDYVLRCSAEDEVLSWLVAIKRAVLGANKKVGCCTVTLLSIDAHAQSQPMHRHGHCH